MAKIAGNLTEDPRYPGVFNRIKLMVYEEAIDRAWGSPLYILHRTGWITNEQREAGDRYQQLTIDYNRTQAKDPDDAIPEGRALTYMRFERYRGKWQASIDALLGCRGVVDRIVLEESYPASEREKIVLRMGLQLLSDLYTKGRTKRVRT